MTAPSKNWLEWLVFGVSAVLLMLLVGFLVYDAVTIGSAPPAIEVTLGDASPQGEQFVIPVSVYNAGDRTAEGVLIEVSLQVGAAAVESAQFEAAFVPRKSTSAGWVVFTMDPSAVDAVEARVLGYQEP